MDGNAPVFAADLGEVVEGAFGQLGGVFQEIVVARAVGKLGALAFAFALPVVGGLGVQRGERGAGVFGHGELGDKVGGLGVAVFRLSCDDGVFAEGGFVEEYAFFQAPFFIQGLVEIAVEFGVVDAEVVQELLGLARIACFWGVDGFAAAVAQDEFAVCIEFVADGVSAEVLMRVQNQDFGFGAGFSIEIGGGQTA